MSTLAENRCKINRCSRHQGLGTWAYVVINGMEATVEVCEEHWQALRDVPRG